MSFNDFRVIPVCTTRNISRLIHVNEVTKQVVAGALYVIRGIFEDSNGDPFSCKISVWERAWLEEPDKLIVEVKEKEAYLGEIPASPFVGDDTTSSSNSGSSQTSRKEF